MRNHIAHDLHSRKYHQKIIPERKRRQMDEDLDEFYFEERYYDDPDPNP